jgi:hypothetical protein
MIVNQKSYSKFTIYLIKNYQKYNQQGNQQETIENEDIQDDSNQQDNQQLTSNQPATNQQLTTIKKVKKVKKEDIYTQIFETAYKNHPRPQAKADTFKNWNSLLTTYTEEQLLQFAENYKSYFESIPETDRPFAYSSNNFYGRKAYYLDFQEARKWEDKAKGQQPPSKYPNLTNYKPGE